MTSSAVTAIPCTFSPSDDASQIVARALVRAASTLVSTLVSGDEKRWQEVKEPVWIDEHDALALHDRMLALHGGAPGLRDDALLKSALARQQQHLAYPESPDMVDLAAVYTAGIVRNHPFVDGNKRTGFVVGILFLELNGYRFTASEEDAAQAVLELAGGNIDETGYGAFIRGNAKRSKKQRQGRAGKT
jgi:death-on-curing protein